MCLDGEAALQGVYLLNPKRTLWSTNRMGLGWTLTVQLSPHQKSSHSKQKAVIKKEKLSLVKKIVLGTLCGEEQKGIGSFSSFHLFFSLLLFLGFICTQWHRQSWRDNKVGLNYTEMKIRPICSEMLYNFQPLNEIQTCKHCKLQIVLFV